MGYYSEVAITIPNEAFSELVKKAEAESKEAYELIKYGSIYQTDKFTTLHFDSVKWYDGYPEIRFITSFMHSVPYVFKRVGEQYDDIESLEADIDDNDIDIYECTSIITGLDVESAGDKITLDELGGGAHGLQQQAA